MDHFAEKLPLGGPSPELARLTIRDMLRMATPYNGTTYKRRPTKDWVGSFFTARTDHEPGSFFCYDTSSSHTLCALVEKRMGRPLLDVLRREALDAIGFSEQSYCIRDPMGISQGGSGLMATPGYAGAAPSCCARVGSGMANSFYPKTICRLPQPGKSTMPRTAAAAAGILPKATATSSGG